MQPAIHQEKNPDIYRFDDHRVILPSSSISLISEESTPEDNQTEFLNVSAVPVNESCFFNEQCETLTPQTECRDGACTCIFEKQPVTKDGRTECVVVDNAVPSNRDIDPTMIWILVAMFLMFITICVVLRLFSRARWRENRTIFNTPNPRLMNVSLLRDNKLLHQERRGSRASARGPSRQPRSRRGSRGSSNASATSNRSNKSPPQAPNMSSATTPMLESVTVEVQEPKA
ncbi:hypothetical protein GEV33_008813 [Tenebrio molitor]|uniref:EB domain-containing protein n=1 Tax=Tenebrio molitor TaxID=7067 RepID=A0A8J6LHT6_TENMO|nr:hypothetical protein GEV33_008813 [Tenebrio molitor]